MPSGSVACAERRAVVDYLNPDLPAGLAHVAMPVVPATASTLEGYGRLIDDPATCPIEIVRWRAQGIRPVDDDTGDQGGTTEGVFVSEWRGDILYGRNEAVGGHYVLAYAQAPEAARTDHSTPPRRMLLWHANYHPDGGQLFFPRTKIPYIVPLALPGDDIAPDKFTGFYCDGSFGLYFHPGVWHTPALPLAPTAEFDDRQGRVHARVSCLFADEFGAYLSVPLRAP
jgi:hypothetical protein